MDTLKIAIMPELVGEEIAIYISGAHKGFLHRRPLSQANRMGRLLARLEDTHSYDFRPIFGGSFGVVVTKRKK